MPLAVAAVATVVEVMAVAAFMVVGADFMAAEAASTVAVSTAVDFMPAARVAAAFTPSIPLQGEA